MAQITHFGPDTSVVGGMASVIEAFREHAVGGEVRVIASWSPSKTRMVVLTAQAARTIRGLPPGAIVHFHLSQRGSFLREGLLIAQARRRGLIVVSTVHGSSFVQFADAHPRLVRSVLERCHATSCLTAETEERIRRIAPRARVFRVPNPIPLVGAVTPADATPELVVFGGEVGRRKGIDVLAAAWPATRAQVPTARCIVVGPSTDLVVPSLPGLEVRPPVAKDEMRRLIESSRVVVLPSRAEAMPMLLLEARSLARPFVATRVGQVPDLSVSDAELVPVDDPEALSAALTHFLVDRNHARKVGEAGQAQCAATHGIDAVDRLWREIYTGCASLTQQ
jgi:glycosyltransferase involved in cell wall biosynthesis